MVGNHRRKPLTWVKCKAAGRASLQHMKTNVGVADKVVRAIIGVALLSMLVLADGAVRWLGLIGLVPLATAFLGYCPLYSPLGIDTCAAGKKA